MHASCSAANPISPIRAASCVWIFMDLSFLLLNLDVIFGLSALACSTGKPLNRLRLDSRGGSLLRLISPPPGDKSRQKCCPKPTPLPKDDIVGVARRGSQLLSGRKR